MNKRKALLLLMAVVLLPGCRDAKVLEKIGFVRTLIMEDAGDEEKQAIKVTISIPKTDQTDSIVYSSIARTFKQAKISFDMQNDRKVVFGQMRQVMFDEALARKGIRRYMDSVFRDPAIGIHTHVLVVEGDVKSMAERKYAQGGTMGEYIDNLIRTDPTSSGKYDTNVHTFLRDYYDDGIEPLATVVKQTDQGLIVDGVALFLKDRFVGKISPQDAMYFALLRGGLSGGSLFMEEVDMQNEAATAYMANVKGNRSIKVSSPPAANGHKPARVVVKLKIRGSLLEYTGHLQLNIDRNQIMLEAAMTKYVRSRLERVIRDLQKTGADAIGIGQYARASMRYEDWKALDWPNAFKHADIRVEVDLKIKDYGTLIES